MLIYCCNATQTIVQDVDGVLGGWASVDAAAPVSDSNSTSPTTPLPSTGDNSSLAPVPPGSGVLPPMFAASTSLGTNTAVLLAVSLGAAMAAALMVVA